MIMNPADKALWYIESHFSDDVSLDDVAQVAGVSRFHLSRAFGVATGWPVMRYLRARRFTEAARVLAIGSSDILSVAVDTGYGSHEAFTRAFRDQFGVTPESVRAQRHLLNLDLVEPVKMNESLRVKLDAPRIVQGKTLHVVGLSERYNNETSAGIPAQWQRFAPYIGHIAGQIGDAAYGVCCNSDDAGNIDYLCGVEVSDFSGIPPELARLRIAEQTYAVFSHRDHISSIRSTWHSIWNEALPQSNRATIDAPNFERYGPEFDPRTGLGGVEIWIPIKQ
jgi:AraC family transcriptional regulator